MKLSVAVLLLSASAAFLAEARVLEPSDASNGKVIFCYFESWTVYRPGNGKYDIENIDPNLCTHVAFTFLGLNEDGSIHVLDPWESNPDGLDGFRRFVSLKHQNPTLKVLVSIGGWNEGSVTYSDVVADPVKRSFMVRQVVEFMEKYGFDGFDFDWEYPNRRGFDGVTRDKENFVLALQELKAAFAPRGYILSAAVNSAKRNVDISYDVPALNEVLDHINVMAYDFHGDYDGYVGHHAPLYSAAVDAEYNNSDWNIDDGINYWIEAGAEPSKINFGIATYARTFTLSNASNAELYAPISGAGTAGPYTRMAGVLGYNEICQMYPNVPDVWNAEQQVYHKVANKQWIGYENTESIAIKSKYAIDQKLGGFMVWSLDTDDFLGLCGDGTYPLIRTIHSTLSENGFKVGN